MPEKIEYEIELEENDELIEFDGVKLPKSVKEKIANFGRLDTTKSIQRIAKGNYSDLFEDMDLDKTRPGDILKTLATQTQAFKEQLEELQAGTGKQLTEKEKTLQELEKAKLAQEKKYQKELQAIKLNSVKENTFKDVKSELMRLKLKPEFKGMVETMIGQHFDHEVSDSGLIFSEKGKDGSYYVDSELAGPEQIAAYISDKMPSAFDRVASGGNTGKPGKVNSVSGDIHKKPLRALEEEAWA